MDLVLLDPHDILLAELTRVLEPKLSHIVAGGSIPELGYRCLLEGLALDEWLDSIFQTMKDILSVLSILEDADDVAKWQ